MSNQPRLESAGRPLPVRAAVAVPEFHRQLITDSLELHTRRLGLAGDARAHPKAGLDPNEARDLRFATCATGRAAGRPGS
jgi:hypothetical protein